jgi:hypothetical protein
VADSPLPETPGRPRPADARHDGDLSPSPDGHRALLIRRVFVSDEVVLDVSLPAARAGLIRSGLLGGASAGAYRDGIAGLARPGAAAGLPGLVQVYVQDLAAGGDPGRLALRWEAAGPDGGLFPALDADITLAPAGERSTTLTVTGVYRLPPGSAGAGLDQAIVRAVATTTIRAFLYRVTGAISHPAGAAGPGTGAAGPDPPPVPPEPQTP